MAESGGGRTVKPGSGPAGLEGIHPLAQAGERNARQHVTGPGRGQAGRRIGVNKDASIGRCYDRVAALEQQAASAKGGSRPGAGKLMSCDAGKEPGEFAL